MAGSGKELKGSLKKGAGKLVGDPEMESEGAAEQTAGRTRRKTSAAAKEATGTAKRGLGKLTGKKNVELKGEAQRQSGRAQRS
jgi:uncharacterized protein YjbJ (UPF0337 family)